MASVEWETPQDFFNTLNDEFNFTLDVCALQETAKCDRYYTPIQNGLLKPWKGSCWMNPPYNKDVRRWVAKAWETAQEGHTVVALLQCRSGDTKWWHNFVMRSSEVRFVKDRLHFSFNGKSNRANISSIVVVFGPHCQGPPKVCSIDTKGKKLKARQPTAAPDTLRGR